LPFFQKISTRTEKVGSVIRRALAPHLIKFEPEHGIIAITAVEVFPDLSAAKVFFDAPRRAAKLEKKLNKMAGLLKKEISQNLTQKRTPNLLFVIDAGILAANKIDELLREK